jgi:hypothetical protein
MEPSEHHCLCGCGQETRQDRHGNCRRYIRGHNSKRGSGQGWMEQGYLFLSVKGTRIALHRWLMEQHLGRKLLSNEIIHHKDWNKLNNSLDNLELTTNSEHRKIHTIGRKIKRWTVEERERALYLNDAGMTIDLVAKLLGRPYSGTQAAIAKQRTTTQAAKERRCQDGQDGTIPPVQEESEAA